MPTKTITDFSAASALTGDEYFVLMQGGVTKKTQLRSPLIKANLLNPILNDGNSLYSAQFINPADTDQWIVIQSGLTEAHRSYFAFVNYAGTAHLWLMGKNGGGGSPSGDACLLYDAIGGVHRYFMAPGDASLFSSNGAYTVQLGDTLLCGSDTGGVHINADPFAAGATGGFTVWSGGQSPVKWLAVQAGNVRMGIASRPTNATDGFAYMPSMAGTPSGTPTAYTGFCPYVFDTTGKKLWIYDTAAAGWKSVTLA
jgi:hypothetical protein